jgi:hypothetical protein
MSLLASLVAYAAAVDTSRVPATADPVLQSLRPTGRVIGEVYVHPSGDGDATTLAAGFTLARTMQTTLMTAEGLAHARITPNYRVNIVVASGTYTEFGVTPPPWAAVYAENPADPPLVRHVVTGDASVITGVVVTGQGIYWEGVNIELDRTTSALGWPKYPVHHSATSTGTSIFAACTLFATSGGSIIPGVSIGADMESNSTTLLYDVDMPSGVTNMHGYVTNTGPITTMFVNCTGLELGARDDGGAAGSQLWFVGGSSTTVKAGGVGTTLHLDPATVVTTVTKDGPQDASTAWPVPTGGLSAADRAHYGM